MYSKLPLQSKSTKTYFTPEESVKRSSREPNPEDYVPPEFRIEIEVDDDFSEKTFDSSDDDLLFRSTQELEKAGVYIYAFSRIWPILIFK